MGIIKGHDLMLFAGGKSIGYATSHTLEITGNSTEISHKDIFNYWQTGVIQTMSWTATTENLYSLDTDHGKTLADLFDSMAKGEEVSLVFSQAGTDTRNKKEEEHGLGAVPYVPGYPQFSGKAVITSLSLNAADGDNASFSCSFTGTGPLTYTKTAPGANAEKNPVKSVTAKENEKV